MRFLVDTSAWIEYLRATGSAVNRTVRSGLVDNRLVTTDAVVLEVLAGARDEHGAFDLSVLLARAEFVPQSPMSDVESAARLYRACRRQGKKPRSQIDCLIAAVAIRNGIPVLHRDRDFGVIAEHSALELVTP